MPTTCCEDQAMTWIQQADHTFVGCPQPQEESTHTRFAVDRGSIDLAYLQHLVTYGAGPDVGNGRERCSFWDIAGSKRKHCRK